MDTLRVELTTPRTPVEVHAFLTDAALQPQWRSDVLRSELAGGLTGATGAYYEQTIDDDGTERTVETELVDDEYGRLVVFRTEEHRVTVTLTHTIAPEGEGSRVVADLDVEVGRTSRLLRRDEQPAAEARAVRYGHELAAALDGVLD